MKILYGVQATGNGHITRARVMAPELKAANSEVTYLFSGRPKEKLFEMDIFGQYEWREGLTFSTKAGRVQYFKTAISNHPLTFLKDVKALDLSGYDLIISDFEPVTAWAAQLKKVPLIGLGHQYAFNYRIPITGDDVLARTVMKHYAPATLGLGLHWHHFDQPILPPIIETPAGYDALDQNKIVVYLPFEELCEVIALLKPFKNYAFFVYSADVARAESWAHINLRPLSRTGFQKDLRDCQGIICNSGFELVSEALQMGKKILVKPLKAQMEQLSNALALEKLKFGAVMEELDGVLLGNWLDEGKAIRVIYPNTAKMIVEWLLQGNWRISPEWIDEIWRQVHFPLLEPPEQVKLGLAANRSA